MLFDEVIRSDVLVIGCGGAGLRAAIEARRNNINVVLVDKGIPTKNCATIYQSIISDMSGYSACLNDGDKDSCEQHFRDIIIAGDGLCDIKLAKIVAYEAPKRLIELERYGLNIEKVNKDYKKLTGCFATRPRMYIINTNELLHLLKEEAKQIGVEFYENVMILDLIVQNGCCVGAIGIDQNERLLLLKAKSTIVATGGACQLYPLSLVPLTMTGDGYALSLRIGVELVNMELLQMGIGIIHKPYHLLLNPYGLWSLYPKIYNSEGEEFIKKYLPKDLNLRRCFDFRSLHFPFTTSDISKFIDIAIQKEIIKGKGTKNMGVYLDLTQIPEQRIIESAGSRFKWLLSKGIDLRKDMVEISIFAHCNNGGIKINEKAETNVARVYAAGEVAGGPHGADRLGGNMLATCQVFGARAGIYAAEKAKVASAPSINLNGLKEKLINIYDILRRKEGISANYIARKIKEIMWTSALIVRNENALNNALNCLIRLEKVIKRSLYLEDKEKLFETLSVMNLIDVGKTIVITALTRKESRGTHYREDFPNKDDNNWRKSIAIRKIGEKIIKKYIKWE